MPSPIQNRRFLILVILLCAFWLRINQLVTLPPGLHFDEAANGILSGDIGLRGDRPLFITSYTGKETLFFYIAGLIMRAGGESIFTLRLASVFSGFLTIAAAVWLGKEIGHQLQTISPTFQKARVWLPIVLAILLATHFPHLIFSRLGFRAITQPLFQALTVAAFLRGLRTNQTSNFIVAGVALGLTGYTYLAARLFPVLFGIFLLPLLRQRWRQIGMMLLTATAAFAPLGWYFWQNPDTFWVRIGQVAGVERQWTDYAASIGQSLAMIGVEGDPYWRFNIPDRPLLEIGWFILWVVGVTLLLWGLRTAKNEPRALVGLVLLTPLIMILPTALALDEIVPSNLRAIGLYPFILVPTALALCFLLVRLPLWLQQGSLVILLVGSAIWVQGVYFDSWGSRADTFYDSDADMVALAAYLDSVAPAYDHIYVGALHYQHPTMAFVSDSYDQVKWLVGSDAVVVPESGRGVLLFPQSSPPPEWLMVQDPLTAPLGPAGKVLFWAWDSAEIDLPAIPPDQNLALTNFSNFLRLDGWQLVDGASPAPTLRLFWHVLGTPDRNFSPFVHIVDATDFRWAQAETIAYPAEQWQVGETVVQEVALALPAGMPASSDYETFIGLFEGNDRLPLVDKDGRFAGNTRQVSPSYAGNGLAPSTPPNLLLNEMIEPGVELVGYDWLPVSAETGTNVTLSLHWQITQAPTTQTFEITLPSLADQSLPFSLLSGTLPTHPTYPFYAIQRLPLPVSELATSGTLALESENQTIVSLTDLTVIPTERTMSQPEFATAVGANFGEVVSLVGYSLTTTDANTRRLSLVWQAEQDIDTNYTVFVHVLNADGTCCIWQQDAMPQANAYPMSRWVDGEFVVDVYEIGFSAETNVEYPLEIGLYQAENGQRLPIIGGEDHIFLESIIGE